MIQLKPIIDIREIPPCAARSRQGLPSIRTLVRESAAPDEDTILDYLRQGVPCGVFNDPRLIYDVLTPGNRLDPDSNVLLTDGVWLWPKCVLYYLARYHLELPAAFIEHAKQNGWRIDPSLIPLRELSVEMFDAIPESPTAHSIATNGPASKSASTAITIG